MTKITDERLREIVADDAKYFPWSLARELAIELLAARQKIRADAEHLPTIASLTQDLYETEQELAAIRAHLHADDQRAWEALGKPEGTYDTTNVERLCKQIEANKALFEICANAIVQHYQALEDGLPAKAESFLQELLKALYIYCPKESPDGTFSELARKMRFHIWTFKSNES